MRVYFGVCGVGLGHVGRCIPVAKGLRQLGHEVIFSTYKEACDYVQREKFPLCKSPPISFAVRPDGGVDFRKTTVYPGIFSVYIFLAQLKAEIEFMRAFAPDCVVSDSRISSLMAAKLLGIPALTLLNLYKVTIPRERRFLNLARIADGGILTVIGKVWTIGKHILIPDFPHPYTLSQSNLEIPPSRKKKVKLIGPILPTRPQDLPKKQEIREKLGFDEKPLIFVPISGSIKEKEYFSYLMRRILRKLPDKYQIVMSLGEPNSSMESKQEGNLTIFKWITNRFEYLKASDLIISRAGLGTLSQAICYGKPLLLVPTPSQTEQRNNAYRAQELGVAKVLDQRNLDYKLALSSIQEIMNGQYLTHVERIQQEVEKHDATDTIINLITKTECLQ